MFDRKRREFIALLGGAAAWPLTARAQPGEKMRHIGVLLPVAEADLVGQARLGAFLQGLQQLGWADGRNVRIDTRWGARDLDLIRKYARELVALGPDAIMANGTEATAALRQVTRTIPIVFAPSSIRSAPAMSRAWHGRAVTSQAFPAMNLP